MSEEPKDVEMTTETTSSNGKNFHLLTQYLPLTNLTLNSTIF